MVVSCHVRLALSREEHDDAARLRSTEMPLRSEFDSQPVFHAGSRSTHPHDRSLRRITS